MLENSTSSNYNYKNTKIYSHFDKMRNCNKSSSELLKINKNKNLQTSKSLHTISLFGHKKAKKNTNIKLMDQSDSKNSTRLSKINNRKSKRLTHSLIQTENNNSKIIKSNYSNQILDNYEYNTAINYDKRKFCRILYICILAKENIINIFLFRTPFDIFPLRICLFIFTYSCDLAFNTIFYSNENISEKYHYKGNNLFLFSFINNWLNISKYF